MRLTTVIGSVNNNPRYYYFIPKQITFWKKFDINFIAIFVGDTIPSMLEPFKDNIILWNKNLNLNTTFVAQNIRMYYTALLKLPDDEMAMITDMDMLPMNDTYYKSGLENFTKKDFIYYRNIQNKEIYMCYNAAHPETWGEVFEIKNENDVENKINSTYNNTYTGVPGSNGWNIDQLLMYSTLINYPHLKILNRPIKRLQGPDFYRYLGQRVNYFIHLYDDCHFHRDFMSNIHFIKEAEQQLFKMK